jgi:ABC-2 type transport system permease protein
MNHDALPPATALMASSSPSKALRRLFLTLFLRGRTSRGLQKKGAPGSIGRKLALTIAFYGLFGLVALGFLRQPIFTLSVYLHGMTFVFLGLFVAASAGEVLFNREETDILLHRPVTPNQLLRAKIGVMEEISLWLAGAFNLVGFFVGVACRDGHWLYPLVHAVSSFIQSLFCTGTVVLVYQLCLRWFGRQRLEGMMTLSQVIIAIAAVTAGQIVPHVLNRFGSIHLSVDTWWIALLPPAWFAGFDDALAGTGNRSSWILGCAGVIITAVVLWLALGRLAKSYEVGLQAVNETSAKTKARGTRRAFVDFLLSVPPIRWWLRDPVARASFKLTAAYLVRDRDVKLRVYPGLAPLLVIPFVFLFQSKGQATQSGLGVAFTGGYLGLVPMLGLNLLQYSQQWQASDLFRSAPMAGPAQLCHGARRAVLVFLTAPMLLLFGVVAFAFRGRVGDVSLVLPGLIALPLYSLIPCLGGKGVPLSRPADEAKSAGRGLTMAGVVVISMLLGFAAMVAVSRGWLYWLILCEAAVVGVVYGLIRSSLGRVRWGSLE